MILLLAVEHRSQRTHLFSVTILVFTTSNVDAYVVDLFYVMWVPSMRLAVILQNLQFGALGIFEY